MTQPISPAPIIAALPVSRPFVAPEELARESGHRTLLRLGANESAFGPAPAAVAAMQAELERTAWYGDPESAELREALAERHACGVANVLVGAGIDDLLGLAVRSYLAPGDVSVAVAGTYPTYAYHVFGAGARYETIAYRADGTVDLAALARRANETNARLVYLANPDNPSGSFASREAIAELLETIPAGAMLVLDEAYGDFVSPEELPPEGIDPRVIRTRTFSKAYGLAGARIGYALAPAASIEQFGKIRLQYNVNRLAQVAALASLGAGDFVASVVAEVARGRAEYASFAAARGLDTIASRTNFVCIGLDSRERAEAIVRELLALGVFIRKPGTAPIDRFVRVTVGTAPERARFFAAFDAALAGVRPVATA